MHPLAVRTGTICSFPLSQCHQKKKKKSLQKIWQLQMVTFQQLREQIILVNPWKFYYQSFLFCFWSINFLKDLNMWSLMITYIWTSTGLFIGNFSKIYWHWLKLTLKKTKTFFLMNTLDIFWNKMTIQIHGVTSHF